ncbi:MAG: RNA-binding protein [Desulfurococcaceae archaeon]
MRILGLVETQTKDGYIVVRPSIRDPLEALNLYAFDENARRIGKIVDVIGRTDDPRLVIKAESQALVSELLGKPLYYMPRKHKR